MFGLPFIVWTILPIAGYAGDSGGEKMASTLPDDSTLVVFGLL